MTSKGSTVDRNCPSIKRKMESGSTDDLDEKVEYLDEDGCWQRLYPDSQKESPSIED